MSDHLPIIATRTFKRVKNNNAKHVTITYRDIKNLNKTNFIASLKKAPWDCAFVFDKTDDVVDAWYKIFNGVVEDHLPLKQKRVKHKVQPKWFNTNISQEIKARDKLYREAIRKQSEAGWDLFRRAKNKVTQLIRRTKQAYFKNKFNENKKDSKKLWNLIKCLSKDDKDNGTVIEQLVEDGKKVTDKNTIAETLNSFFINQPKNLVKSLGLESLFPNLSHIQRSNSAIDIPHITHKKVADLLLSIPTHKATGDDGISAKLLRIAAPAILPSLTKLLNQCLDSQTFPAIWKIAKVTPIFKRNGRSDDKKNYRPISVLPVISKLLEKHIYEHLCMFLKNNGLLYKLQSGFRKLFSTETALIRLVDQLLLDLDEDKVSGMLFVDYKKAFDLIDHQLLISKLQALGVGDQFLPLFRDYLTGRRQYVSIDGVCSTSKMVTMGVPQGSILGPVLFLVFINDLPTALQHSVADIYADDTTISYSVDYKVAPAALTERLQSDINELENWSSNNRMIINASKSKSMIVTGKRLDKKMVHSFVLMIMLTMSTRSCHNELQF